MRLTSILAASLCLAAAAAGAQPTRVITPPDTGAFARARRLVSEGNGALGRALVDTVLAATPPGTPAYAEALYWRATLAERSADAERDYRRIAVEYATSPRAADALVRLAQLDLVRGQPAAAREHLTRLLRDHTDAPTRARASYWLARAALDANDPRGACEALNDATSATEPEGDLARQVVALRARVPRCPAPASQRVATAAPNASTPNASAPPPNASAPTPPPAAARPATAGAGRFTVQVAAYDSRPGAEALAARLQKRGVDAYVVSGGATPDTPPFRVRVGRWATRGEAAAALADLKKRGLAGFVAEERAP
jgi:cell division septation protein DedD